MGIIQTLPRLAVLVKRSGPVLEGDFVESEVRWDSRSVSSEDIPLHDVPKSLLAGGRIQIDSAVRPVRRGRRRLGRAPATSAARASPTCAALPAAARSRVLRDYRHRQDEKTKHRRQRNTERMISH